MIGDITKEKQAQVDYYNNIKHTTAKQDLKRELDERDERLERRKIAEEKASERVSKQPKTMWLNTLRKRIPVSEVTTQMMEDEESLWEYLHNND